MFDLQGSINVLDPLRPNNSHSVTRTTHYFRQQLNILIAWLVLS